jgi:hypothetical protein
LAEYRIVYPVVAGSSPAVLALVASCGLRWVVAREFWHASFSFLLKVGVDFCPIISYNGGNNTKGNVMLKFSNANAKTEAFETSARVGTILDRQA